MVEGDPRHDRFLMVIGDSGDPLGDAVTRLAGEYEIPAVSCRDIYAAVAELASRQNRCVLVVGPLEELASENGAFFDVAVRNGAQCCCFWEAESGHGAAHLQAAMQAQALLIGRLDDLPAIIEDWLATGGCPPEPPVPHAERTENRRAGDELRTTQAEMDALLQRQMDDYHGTSGAIW